MTSWSTVRDRLCGVSHLLV